MADALLKGGSLVDGTGGPVRPATSVLVSGDRIEAVGAEAERLAAGSGASVIDVSGLTVMPGLIDAHCHVTLGEPASNDELFHHRDPASAALLAAFNVGKILRAGVTSFVDVDGIYDTGIALRDAVAAGMVEGPTMRAGSYALMTSVGGTAGRMIPDRGTAGYAEVVRTKDEMIQTTRRHIKNGADHIKIHATGTIPSRRGEDQVWTLEELRVVCDTAHDLGVPVTVHSRGAACTRDAALAGADVIYHASFMDEAALQAILENGSALCPVFTFLANLAEFGAKAGATSTAQDVFRGEMEQTGAMVRRAFDLGVPLFCGSESGFSITPYGHWHHREMEVFVQQLGMAPLDAIMCGTKNGALAMGEEGEVGTIEPGRRADILVLDGDPVADISVLGDKSRFRHLFLRGNPVDLTRPWPERGPLPGERVVNWSAELLTWDLVHPRAGM